MDLSTLGFGEETRTVLPVDTITTIMNSPILRIARVHLLCFGLDNTRLDDSTFLECSFASSTWQPVVPMKFPSFQSASVRSSSKRLLQQGVSEGVSKCDTRSTHDKTPFRFLKNTLAGGQHGDIVTCCFYIVK